MAPVEALYQRVEAPLPGDLTLHRALVDAWSRYAIPTPLEGSGLLLESEQLEVDAHVRSATVVAFAGCEAEALFVGKCSRSALADDRRRLANWLTAARVEESRMLARGRQRARDFVRVNEDDIRRCAVLLAVAGDGTVWCGPGVPLEVSVPPLPNTGREVGKRFRDWIISRTGAGANTSSAMHARLVRAGVQISRATWYRILKGNAQVRPDVMRQVLAILGATGDDLSTVLASVSCSDRKS
jgi:hypothetical protein